MEEIIKRTVDSYVEGLNKYYEANITWYQDSNEDYVLLIDGFCYTFRTDQDMIQAIQIMRNVAIGEFKIDDIGGQYE